MNILIQPFSEKSMGDYIQEVLSGDHGEFVSFQASVAFAKRSGVQHIEDQLKAFLERGAQARIVVGVDLQGTSSEGLAALLDAMGDSGELFVNHDENTFVTFHPKVYFFEGTQKAILIVGSGNLTQGGLYSNDEGFAILELDPSSPEDQTVIAQYKNAFDQWCDDDSETVRRVDRDFIETLKEAGYTPSEILVPSESDRDAEEEARESERKNPLFGKMKGRKRPPRRNVKKVKVKKKPAGQLFGEPEPSSGFVMTLMRTDVGTGQTTLGASRRSPEVFIPLSARNADPEFWGWKDKFAEDSSRPGKYDRTGVRMRLGGEVITVNMMTWPIKHDFRLRSEKLRSAGTIGDLIRIEKTDDELTGFDYYVEIIPQGTSDYNSYFAVCTNKTRNSERLWGYY